jgi:hypothetical protein
MSQQQLNISLDKTTAMSCDKCGHEVFIEGLILRKASRFLTGTAQDSLVPIPVFSCTKCGHVNEEFLPLLLRNQPTPPTPPEEREIREGEIPEKPKNHGGLTIVRK